MYNISPNHDLFYTTFPIHIPFRLLFIFHLISFFLSAVQYKFSDVLDSPFHKKKGVTTPAPLMLFPLCATLSLAHTKFYHLSEFHSYGIWFDTFDPYGQPKCVQIKLTNTIVISVTIGETFSSLLFYRIWYIVVVVFLWRHTQKKAHRRE